jgi:hypothetical protein
MACAGRGDASTTPAPSRPPSDVPSVNSPTPAATNRQPISSATVASPTVTAIADTPAGAMLEVGQFWKTDGVQLKVSDVKLNPGSYDSTQHCYLGSDIRVSVGLKNTTPSPIVFAVTSENVQVVTNTGVTLKTCWNGSDEFSIAPNQEANLASILVEGSITDPRISSVTISLSVSRIQNARWTIPIHH